MEIEKVAPEWKTVAGMSSRKEEGRRRDEDNDPPLRTRVETPRETPSSSIHKQLVYYTLHRIPLK